MTQQDALPAEGMPEPKTPHKLSFMGLKMTSLADVFEMDTEHTFELSGVVRHIGPKRDAKGNLFKVVEIVVDKVTPKSYIEPRTVEPVTGDDAGDEA